MYVRVPRFCRVEIGVLVDTNRRGCLQETIHLELFLGEIRLYVRGVEFWVENVAHLKQFLDWSKRHVYSKFVVL